MPEALTTKRMSIVPTTRCTLKCKLCSNHMPAFLNPSDIPVQIIMQDIDALFSLFDHIEWLQFVGGEIFMHPHLAEVYRYSQRYVKYFDKLILETNATLLPKKEELEALSEYGDMAQVMISDYGSLSAKRDQFVDLLEAYRIPYILKKYYGEDQHCNGWIDNTGRRNYGESDEVVYKNFKNCPQMKIENMHCYSGKLYSCPNSLFMSELRILSPKHEDFVDLGNNEMTWEEKKNIIKNFYSHPVEACRYCMWKYADTVPRYHAAEQLYP